MKNKLLLFFILLILLVGVSWANDSQPFTQEKIDSDKKSYWLIMSRKSSMEFLYHGVSGDVGNSRLIKIFQVKPGIPGLSPTPLPQLLGRKYWLIIKKESTAHNPETAPYFLTLDIPVTDSWPYGPVPYKECNGQCDWMVPGYFGLHGINGNSSKLSAENLGSSGCVRHTDGDITYLYNLLDPKTEEIRYYIKDA